MSTSELSDPRTLLQYLPSPAHDLLRLQRIAHWEPQSGRPWADHAGSLRCFQFTTGLMQRTASAKLGPLLVMALLGCLAPVQPRTMGSSKGHGSWELGFPALERLRVPKVYYRASLTASSSTGLSINTGLSPSNPCKRLMHVGCCLAFHN